MFVDGKIINSKQYSKQFSFMLIMFCMSEVTLTAGDVDINI